MPRLHYPRISLQLVVDERHCEIAHEGEDAVGGIPESVKEVTGFTLLAAAAALGTFRLFRSRVRNVAGFHNLEVADEKAVEVGGRQRGFAGLPGCFDRRLNRQQMVDYCLGPRPKDRS